MPLSVCGVGDSLLFNIFGEGDVDDGAGDAVVGGDR